MLGARLDLRTEEGKPPLHLAMRYDRREQTRTFLDWMIMKGADMDARDLHGRTVLNEAVFSGNLTATQWVLNKLETREPSVAKGKAVIQAALAVTDLHGRTVLHVAAAQGHATLVTLLLNRGANALARNGAGELPL